MTIIIQFNEEKMCSDETIFTKKALPRYRSKALIHLPKTKIYLFPLALSAGIKSIDMEFTQ